MSNHLQVASAAFIKMHELMKKEGKESRHKCLLEIKTLCR